MRLIKYCNQVDINMKRCALNFAVGAVMGCIFLVIIILRGTCFAQDTTPPTSSNNAVIAISGLKYKQIGSQTILITEGFPYRSDAKTSRKGGKGYDIEIASVKNGVFETTKNSVQPMLAGPLTLVTRGSSFFSPLCTAKDPEKERPNSICDAIGCTWVFSNPGISFATGGVTFKAKKKGATIKFTKEGVEVKGFEMTK